MTCGARLQGSVVPVVTPLRADLGLDSAALRRLVEDLVARGAGGILALGTTGELALVPPRLRSETLAVVADTVAGRVPLLVGCGSPSLAETEREVREAAALGADYCLVVPSFYLPLGRDEILRQFGALRPAADIPLLYYHIPARSGASGGAGTIRALHAQGLIAGLKDSGGFAPDLAETLLEIRAGDGGFEILLGGSSGFLPAAALGIRAVTSVTGCIAPEIEHRLLAHLDAGRIAEAAAEQRRLVRLVRLILSANPANAAVGGKGLLSLLGLCGPWPLPPFAPASVSWLASARGRLAEFRAGTAADTRPLAIGGDGRAQ